MFYLHFKWKTYNVSKNWNSVLKKARHIAEKFICNKILLFENVTFRDIREYIERERVPEKSQFQKRGKTNGPGKS